MTDVEADRLAVLRSDLLTIEDRLKELLGETRSTVRALDRTIREGREFLSTVDTAVKELIETKYADLVHEGMITYQEELTVAIDTAADKVVNEFAQLRNVLMTGNSRGRTMGSALSNLNALPMLLGQQPPDMQRAVHQAIVHRRKKKRKR